MKLLKHYVLQIFKTEDVTEEFEAYVRDNLNRKYKAKEKSFRVYLKEDCEGEIQNVEKVWAKSYLEEVKERGYYLG